MRAQHRLQAKANFTKVFKSPKVKKHHKYLMLLAAYNNKAHARLGLVIAKKHVALAVDRSTVRRIIREAFTAKIDALGNMDIVFLSKPKAGTLDKKKLRKAADNLLMNLK